MVRPLMQLGGLRNILALSKGEIRMNVYVVFERNYGLGENILGIYLHEEVAKAAAESSNKYWCEVHELILHSIQEKPE